MELWVLLWIVVILTVLGIIGVFFSFLNEVLLGLAGKTGSPPD